MLSDYHLEPNSEGDIEKVEIELLLEGIFQLYGFDFRNYSFSSIRRRIIYRMQTEGLDSISLLQDKLFKDPELMRKLLNDFSISVTEMFRDPSFFRTIREKVIPRLKNKSLIRIWHAGCSTGEEVYSMAILLYEEGLYDKSRIYATDMNIDALKKARKGAFQITNMKQYTRNYQQSGGTKEFSEYYSIQDNFAKIQHFLRKNIVFGHHNLATDHSFNEFHVIICRNVLIYFNEVLKRRVYELFDDSLAEDSYVCFGNKETITDTQALGNFHELDRNENIYVKIKQ